MSNGDVVILLEQITALVKAKGSAAEKQKVVLDAASEEDRLALIEFSNWFADTWDDRE
jgi:hypothetical protein